MCVFYEVAQAMNCCSTEIDNSPSSLVKNHGIKMKHQADCLILMHTYQDKAVQQMAEELEEDNPLLSDMLVG